MANNSISCNVAVEGQIFQCPAKLMIGKQNKEFIAGGFIQWGGRSINDVVTEADNDMSNEFGQYIDDLLPQCLPGELSFLYHPGMTVIGVQESGIYFKLAVTKDNTALLFTFQTKSKTSGNDSVLVQALKTAVDTFGIQDFLFYAQTGKQWMLPEIKPDNVQISSVPSLVQSSKFLVYAHFVLQGDSVFVKGVKTLFGLEETELFLGTGASGVTCMVTIPPFKNSILESRNLYMMMQVGKETAFMLRGEFIFSFLKNMTFRVDCGVSNAGFEIEALAKPQTPLTLIGPFSIGDTCLMIKMGTGGLTFGMYMDLYIRKLKIFGAMMLKSQGASVVPQLLSAAISDFSIPTLVDNLLGEHINGIEVLDFIKILGLPFQDMSPFSKDMLNRNDVAGIVNSFNSQVKSNALRLNAAQVRLTSFGNGTDLTDLSRMRHYYINSSGKLQLTAQFYYAQVDATLGDYTIQKGIFICGVLELFKKRFEVLFSLNESEGLLAYAKIPEMDLGFLKIGPSSFEQQNPDTLPVAKNSVLSQFLNPDQRGLVFFLSAQKKNISFYLDGKVDVLKLFSVDARIIFSSGLISVDLQTVWLSILQVSLHLQVNYSDFTSANFEFCLKIDTSKLTEKLTAVTKKIDEAIGKLRQKISDATREIDRAQAHVNELYGQIRVLDGKIADCRRAINNASWWKKAFVAIGKGVEIAAYEVAKAGVYAAIGVATAALQVAKGVVNLGGKVSECVLQAVNGVIKGAMSLFYLNYIELRAKADSNEQYFQAKIGFVALGKTYDLSTTIGKSNMQSSPTGVLSDNINNGMANDLKNIENAANKSNWRKYRHENYTVAQHCNRLDEAKIQMTSSVNLMQRMQEMYVDEYGMPLESFDEMNVSLVDALADVENILSAGSRAGDVSALAQSMGGLKRSVAARERKGVYRDEELTQLKGLIAEYDEARLLYDKVVGSIKTVQKQQQSMEQHCDKIKAMTTSAGDVIVNDVDVNAARLLSQVEEQMYMDFPVDQSGANFINLSREPLIQQCFTEIEKREGITPSEHIQRMRSRSRKGSYISRL